MMPLASTISLAVWVVVMIAFGVAKLIEKTAGSAKKPLNPPPVPGPRGSIRQADAPRAAESEEERTRKFLEALGLPPSTLDPKPAAETMRGSRETVRGPHVPPVPPFVPPEMRGSRDRMPHTPAAAARPARNEIEAQRLERKIRHAEQHRPAHQPPPSQTAGRESPIESFHFAELKTPETPAFHTRSSDVSAIPFEAMNSVAGQLYIKEENARMSELLTLARSPKALRQAILLREILGPPRSLQSLSAASNFASL